MTGATPLLIRRLLRFCLVTPDAERLAAFYGAALGCRTLSRQRLREDDCWSLWNVANGVKSIRLRLGKEIIELLEFDLPGQPYPPNAGASDLRFQHFAIVVADMAQAYRQLMAVPGWTAISADGPQRLPDNTGGVTAFKFRDPDGHPLELLAFPVAKTPAHWCHHDGNSPYLGIDHSAISVSNSAASSAFYERLGLRISATSLNTGVEQERLDGVRGAHVQVTALAPPDPTPHLELLCYQIPIQTPLLGAQNNDVAATRLVFEAVNPVSMIPSNVIDPDGHRLLIGPAF